MIELNYLSIAVAAVAVVAFAAVYYTVFNRQLVALSGAAAETSSQPAWVIVLEVVKSLIVASVVAGLVALLGISDPAGALLLGLALWIAFPIVLLAGSVVHEKVPWRLAAIHAGDWLGKLLLVALIVTAWS